MNGQRAPQDPARGTADAAPIRRPGRIARRLVLIAVGLLSGRDRMRYRQEFLADLYGMTRREQLRYATGVLARVWSLRIALNDTPSALLEKENAMRKPLRCRLRMHHNVRRHAVEASGYYWLCTRCGHETDIGIQSASGSGLWQ